MKRKSPRKEKQRWCGEEEEEDEEEEKEKEEVVHCIFDMLEQSELLCGCDATKCGGPMRRRTRSQNNSRHFRLLPAIVFL